ncbi:MAG: DUF58 domain-containing protein [Pirellulales bacterium]|nr:DUF58 domain-containing protein [Pirellulales bacterium]
MPGERTAHRFLDPAVLAKLQGLELRARRIVEGYFAGLHRSPFHGFSVEFAEHRDYAPGDDLRYVDWKVFGKTDRIYLKQFEEETNLICYLLLDVSQSMQYRGPESPLSKLEYAQCLAASLAYLVLRQQDSVALVTFDDSIRQLISPRGNPTHLKDLLAVMEEVAPTGKTRTGPIFHDLAERLKQRGIIVIISDLFDDVDSVLAGLKHFRHRRHEIILLHVLDRAEREFPFDRVTLFRGLEQLPDVLTDPRSLRKAYLAEFEAYQRRLQAGCRAQGADYVLVPTDRPLDMVLSAYLNRRK